MEPTALVLYAIEELVNEAEVAGWLYLAVVLIAMTVYLVRGCATEGWNNIGKRLALVGVSVAVSWPLGFAAYLSLWLI